MNAIIRPSVTFDQIDFPANARPASAEKVNELAKSIRRLGLQSAPAVVERNRRYTLVTGRHRVEALRVIGEERTRDEVRRARAIAALPSEVKAKAADLGLDRNQSALLEAARAPTPQAQVEVLERRADRAPLPPRPMPLRNLENIAAGELARWIKQTTPNDRPHVIRVLEDAAAILRNEMQAELAATEGLRA